jgi:hypothetical protein
MSSDRREGINWTAPEWREWLDERLAELDFSHLR